MVQHLSLVLFLLLSMTTALGNTTLSHDGYIIKYNDANKINSTRCLLKTKKCDLLNSFNMEVVKELPRGLVKSSDIAYIEPNWKYHTMHVPNDPKIGDQWGLDKIKAWDAWDLSLGSQKVVVAVIDTGIDYTHPDLKNQMWVNEKELNGKAGVDDDGNGYVDDIYGYDFANKDGDPIDDHDHGTHCAGVIGAEHNSQGIAGINANIKLMGLKFLTKSGSGTAADAVLAVKYGVDNGANVLSNSWGGGGSSQAMQEAIEYARDRGVIFVAAAGNEYNNNDSKPTYPASYKIENVIAVAASDINDNKASFSNYGNSVHIAAPGVNVLSTVKGGRYSSMSGTSMACPHVAGALALLMSYEDLSISEIKERLLKTSDYLPNWEELTTNAGRLNLSNLLTNHYPVRPAEPDVDLWVSHNVSIETPHPYEDSKTYEYEITVPSGAEFLRVHFKSFNTEAKYDKVSITAGSRSVSYDGDKGNFYTKHLSVKGLAKVVIKLVTDRSQTREGFEIDHFQVQ